MALQITTKLAKTRNKLHAFGSDTLPCGMSYDSDFGIFTTVFLRNAGCSQVGRSIAKHEDKYGAKVESAEIAYVPVERTPDVGADLKQKVQRLVKTLEENDDISRVWTTLDFGRAESQS